MAENGWLREELSNTQSKLCDSEMRATKAEEERAHYKFMAELNQSTDHNDDKGSVASGTTFLLKTMLTSS